MMASICAVQKDVKFAIENWSLLEKWAEYLYQTGMDPENQLCTDDFAGHLAHNCNLSIKAIMGITGFAILCSMRGEQKQADLFMGPIGMILKPQKWLDFKTVPYRVGYLFVYYNKKAFVILSSRLCSKRAHGLVPYQ